MNYARNAFLYSLLTLAFAAFIIIPINYLEKKQTNTDSNALKNRMSFTSLSGTLTKNNKPYLITINSVDFNTAQKKMLINKLTLKDTVETQSLVAEKGLFDLATNNITLTKTVFTTPQIITHAQNAHYFSEKNEWFFEDIVTQGAFDQPHGMQPQP